MFFSRVLSWFWVTLGILCFATFSAHAQSIASTYPNKPIRIVIGFPPGGGIDIVARMMAPKLTEVLGQSVVIDNRPGANGVLGMDAVAKSAPDGYTIFLGTLGNLSVNPNFYPNLPFNYDKQFMALTQIASVPFLLVVNPALPVKTMAEFIAYAHANPGKLNYSSSGTGGLPHLAGELLSSMTGVDMVHIAYKGSAPSISDVISGQVQFTFEAGAPLLPHVKSGRLRALASTGKERLGVLPDVPALGESLPGYLIVNWYGMVLPMGTPKEAVARLNTQIAKVLALPDIRERMLAMGTEPVSNSPEEFSLFIKSESQKWSKIIHDKNIRIE
jgi:tripartite-type tricarboxylate transporter receptor subunit TctC